MAKLKNERQEKFCLEYIKSDNATQSAINAGYKENSARSTASRMLTNDNIKERIAELTKNYKKKNNLIADAEEVLIFLSETMRGNTISSKFTSEGIEYNATPATNERIKAAELMGKNHAVFTDNLNVKAEIKENKLDKVFDMYKNDKCSD